MVNSVAYTVSEIILLKPKQHSCIHSKGCADTKDKEEESQGCEAGWWRGTSLVVRRVDDNDKHGSSKELREKASRVSHIISLSI